MSNVTTGVVAFCDLNEHEVFKGKSTGRFSIVVTMEDEAASKLADMGVKVKEYEGKKQRKFSSKFDVPVLDLNGEKVSKDIPFGSTVRLAWKDGAEHPEHGVPTYLDAVRLVELNESAITNPEF